MADLYFPVPQWIKSYSYKEGMRQFGWRRSKGKRLHAGCDIYAPLGSPVKTIADGKVVEKALFYNGTFQISVNHPNIGVIRYGEIDKIPAKLGIGDDISAGMQVGVIGQLQGMDVHPMLHLELFKGTVGGILTDRKNLTIYSFVKAGPYQRRSDLMNPTDLLDKLTNEGRF